MSDLTQRERAELLRQLHNRGCGTRMLVLPNVWDAASARIIEQAGFGAVATTSSGVAASLGYPDGQRMSRERHRKHERNQRAAYRQAPCLHRERLALAFAFDPLPAHRPSLPVI